MAQRQTGGRSRALLFLVISGGAALVAVGVLYWVILGYQRQLDTALLPPETLKVVTALDDLHQGVTLAPEMLEVIEVEPAYVPDNVFHDVNDVVGRVPAERILGGEYLRAERLADPNAGIGLNAIIPRGQRALSIAVTGGKAVSGFLNPGNYVDVLLTIMSEKLSDMRTVTMMQAVKVLAVNSRLSAGPDDGSAPASKESPSVMVAVTPEDAERLTHAMNAGSITLTLRNDIDVTKQQTQGAQAKKLLGKTDVAPTKFTNVQSKVKKQPVISAKPADTTLTIIKGTKETVQKIPGSR